MLGKIIGSAVGTAYLSETLTEPLIKSENPQSAGETLQEENRIRKGIRKRTRSRGFLFRAEENTPDLRLGLVLVSRLVG
jgi:hypothetical protein